jgi:hypothetical protein
MEESTCIQCGWTGIPMETEDLGSGLEWCCPQCRIWQHAEQPVEDFELSEQDSPKEVPA